MERATSKTTRLIGFFYTLVKASSYFWLSLVRGGLIYGWWQAIDRAFLFWQLADPLQANYFKETKRSNQQKKLAWSLSFIFSSLVIFLFVQFRYLTAVLTPFLAIVVISASLFTFFLFYFMVTQEMMKKSQGLAVWLYLSLKTMLTCGKWFFFFSCSVFFLGILFFLNPILFLFLGPGLFFKLLSQGANYLHLAQEGFMDD